METNNTLLSDLQLWTRWAHEGNVPSEMSAVLDAAVAALSAGRARPLPAPMTVGDPRNPIRHHLIRDGYAAGFNAALHAVAALDA